MCTPPRGPPHDQSARVRSSHRSTTQPAVSLATALETAKQHGRLAPRAVRAGWLLHPARGDSRPSPRPAQRRLQPRDRRQSVGVSPPHPPLLSSILEGSVTERCAGMRRSRTGWKGGRRRPTPATASTPRSSRARCLPLPLLTPARHSPARHSPQAPCCSRLTARRVVMQVTNDGHRFRFESLNHDQPKGSLHWDQSFIDLIDLPG